MKNIVIAAIIALMILHQDFWYWDDATLIWGFVPIGLAYHALFSILAGVVWALAVVYAWPSHLEEETASMEANERSETTQ